MSHEMEKRKKLYPFDMFSNWIDDVSSSWVGGSHNSGISLSEDDNKVYIEAALPGLKSEEIDISFDKGSLWIKGEHKESEEDKKKQYYYKSSKAFSYHVSLPDNVDEAKDPTATYKDGMMQICFEKKRKSEPKKIRIK